jgi:hypothetical protein
MNTNVLLLLCLKIYLALAIPAFALIWSALIAAKHGDRKRHEDDLESNTTTELNSLMHSV